MTIQQVKTIATFPASLDIVRAMLYLGMPVDSRKCDNHLQLQEVIRLCKRIYGMDIEAERVYKDESDLRKYSCIYRLKQ